MRELPIHFDEVLKLKGLEKPAREGESPVSVWPESEGEFPKYHGSREILWESGWTIIQG